MGTGQRDVASSCARRGLEVGNFPPGKGSGGLPPSLARPGTATFDNLRTLSHHHNPTIPIPTIPIPTIPIPSKSIIIPLSTFFPTPSPPRRPPQEPAAAILRGEQPGRGHHPAVRRGQPPPGPAHPAPGGTPGGLQPPRRRRHSPAEPPRVPFSQRAALGIPGSLREG